MKIGFFYSIKTFLWLLLLLLLFACLFVLSTWKCSRKSFFSTFFRALFAQQFVGMNWRRRNLEKKCVVIRLTELFFSIFHFNSMQFFFPFNSIEFDDSPFNLNRFSWDRLAKELTLAMSCHLSITKQKYQYNFSRNYIEFNEIFVYH